MFLFLEKYPKIWNHIILPYSLGLIERLLTQIDIGKWRSGKQSKSHFRTVFGTSHPVWYSQSQATAEFDWTGSFYWFKLCEFCKLRNNDISNKCWNFKEENYFEEESLGSLKSPDSEQLLIPGIRNNVWNLTICRWSSGLNDIIELSMSKNHALVDEKETRNIKGIRTVAVL